MNEENELYFDNLEDELSLEEQLIPGDGDDNEPANGGRGDLNIALKKEREEKKALKEQLAAREKELERRELLLQQLGQQPNREQRRTDPAQVRQALQDGLLERPDEILNQRDQVILANVQQRNAPLYARVAKLDVIEDPDFGPLYKDIPAFKETTDAYIANCIQQYGVVDPEALNVTLAHLKRLCTEGKPGTATNGKPSTDAAKGKLTSIADKGNNNAGRKTMDEILEEKLQLAEKANRGNRRAAKEYSDWEKTPEGKAVLNRALQQELSKR